MSHLIKPTGIANVYSYQKQDGTVSYYPYIGKHSLGTFPTLDEAVKKYEDAVSKRKQLAEQRKQIKEAKRNAKLSNLNEKASSSKSVLPEKENAVNANIEVLV